MGLIISIIFTLLYTLIGILTTHTTTSFIYPNHKNNYKRLGSHSQPIQHIQHIHQLSSSFDDSFDDSSSSSSSLEESFEESLSSLISSSFFPSSPNTPTPTPTTTTPTPTPTPTIPIPQFNQSIPFSKLTSLLSSSTSSSPTPPSPTLTPTPDLTSPPSSISLRDFNDELEELENYEFREGWGKGIIGLDFDSNRNNDWTVTDNSNEPNINTEAGLKEDATNKDKSQTTTSQTTSSSSTTKEEVCPKCHSSTTPSDTFYLKQYSYCQSCRSDMLSRDFGEVNVKGEDEWDRKRRMRGGEYREIWKSEGVNNKGRGGRDYGGGRGVKYSAPTPPPRSFGRGRVGGGIEFGEGEEEEEEDGFGYVLFNEVEEDIMRDIGEDEDDDNGRDDFNKVEGIGEAKEIIEGLKDEVMEYRKFCRMLLRRLEEFERREGETTESSNNIALQQNQQHNRRGGGREWEPKGVNEGVWEKVVDPDDGDTFWMNVETGEQKWDGEEGGEV